MKRPVNFKNLVNSRNKVTRRKEPRSLLATAEGLENRVLLTAQIDLVGAELQIEGTNNDDVIEVDPLNGNDFVRGEDTKWNYYSRLR